MLAIEGSLRQHSDGRELREMLPRKPIGLMGTLALVLWLAFLY